jgi:DNA-binding SARP family transcriptional activator
MGEHELGLRLIRGFTLTVDGAAVPLVWSAQRLLAYLAVQAHPVARNAIAGALWPSTVEAKANASLRTSLFRVQRVSRDLIDVGSQNLAIAAPVHVDLRQARHEAALLLDTSADGSAMLTTATRARLSADLLPGWYGDEDWLLTEQEQYRQLRLYALEALCARLIVARRYGEAVDAGLAAVRADPLRESAHEMLVKAHLAAGNRRDAMSQYERCRRILHDELGLPPSPALRRLLPVVQKTG